MYHHVNSLTGEQATSGSLTVKTEIFGQQMDYLTQQGYNVISIDQAVDGVIAGGGLPAKPMVITFDDGYTDFYTDAWPILQAHNFPATLFLTTGLVQSSGDYLTWDQLRQMNASGLLTVGNHTWSHQSVAGGVREKVEYEIKTAQKQIEDFLGQKPTVFSYPYGSSSSMAHQILQEQGIRAAFLTYPRRQCAGALYHFGRRRIGNASLSAYGI